MEYFGEYWFAFGIIHAVNTHENGIFRQWLVPKYSREYRFAFGKICALNTRENIIFRQLILYWRQPNILRNISTPKAAEILHFYVYWLHILLRSRTIFSEIFRHQQLLKHYIFMCLECAYYSECKAIFSGIFRHQQLPKCSIFMYINCMYYTKGKPILSEIFRHQ